MYRKSIAEKRIIKRIKLKGIMIIACLLLFYSCFFCVPSQLETVLTALILLLLAGVNCYSLSKDKKKLSTVRERRKNVTQIT